MNKRNIIFTFIYFISLGVSAQEAFNIKYGPYLQNIQDDEATVVWVTSKDALSWIEIAPDDESHFYAEKRQQFFETNNGRKQVGELHKVKITGLNKGTKYRYRIYSREVIDNYNWDTSFGKVTASSAYNPFSFTTLDKSKDEFSFVVVNDIHADTTMLHELLNQTDMNRNDFVIYNGDMMSHLNSEKHMFDGFITKSVELFAPYTPFFFTRGNHETRGPFSTQFMNYFPTSTGKPYYTLRQGPAYFIFLDGGEDKPDTDIEYGGLSAFDQYREEQSKWLKEVIDSEEFNEALIKIVVIHIPPFANTWYGTHQVEKAFIPILNSADIDLMFSGHTHKYELINKGDKNNNFPIVINSNNEVMNISITPKSINIIIKDRKGKITKQLEF